MNAKFIAMTMAGLMTMQTAALASSRTEGIAEAAIADAKAKLTILQSNIDGIDQSLANAQKAIEKREKSVRGLQAANVATAAIGAGLAGLAYFTLSRSGAQGVNAVVSIGAGVSTLVSALSGVATAKIQGETPTVNTVEQISTLRKDVKSAKNLVQDDESLELLEKLDTRLQYLQGDLGRYNEGDKETALAHRKAQVAQLAGVATVLLATMTGNSQLVVFGSLVYSAGNLSTLIQSMNDSQAAFILKEIADARETIQTTFVAP